MCVFDESGQKSCRIVYFPTCLVLVIIVGVLEVWGFLAPRFFGLLLPFMKAIFEDVLGNGRLLVSGK